MARSNVPKVAIAGSLPTAAPGPKGYLLDQFADAFKRYLPPHEDPPSDRPQDPPSPRDPPSKAPWRRGSSRRSLGQPPAPKASDLEAARITATYARNRDYLWASLRRALSGYPALAAQVLDAPGTVNSLPLGTATVHVREGAKPAPVSGSIVITDAELEAARKGRIVVRQGDFTGAPEVKP